MNTLFISGSPNTGKTQTIYDLTAYLHNYQEYDIKTGYTSKGYPLTSDFFKTPKPDEAKGIDFLCVLEKKIEGNKPITVLINSASDELENIENLIYLFEENSEVDTVISSIRADGFNDEMRTELYDKFQKLLIELGLDTMEIEIPLAKITSKDDNFVNALRCYQKNINELVKRVLRNPPFNLQLQ